MEQSTSSKADVKIYRCGSFALLYMSLALGYVGMSFDIKDSVEVGLFRKVHFYSDSISQAIDANVRLGKVTWWWRWSGYGS